MTLILTYENIREMLDVYTGCLNCEVKDLYIIHKDKIIKIKELFAELECHS